MPLPAWKHPSEDRGERHATQMVAAGGYRDGPGRVPGESQAAGVRLGREALRAGAYQAAEAPAMLGRL